MQIGKCGGSGASRRIGPGATSRGTRDSPAVFPADQPPCNDRSGRPSTVRTRHPLWTSPFSCFPGSQQASRDDFEWLACAPHHVVGCTARRLHLRPPDRFSPRSLRSGNGGVLRKHPARVRLQSISPNPVSTTSTVVYELPRSQSVRVAVYDILGRRVAMPIDTRQSAGRHRRTLDVSKLNSGTYFVRLTTPNTTRNQPFRVVR